MKMHIVHSTHAASIWDISLSSHPPLLRWLQKCVALYATYVWQDGCKKAKKQDQEQELEQGQELELELLIEACVYCNCVPVSCV